LPFEMNRFRPLMAHPPRVRVARVTKPAGAYGMM